MRPGAGGTQETTVPSRCTSGELPAQLVREPVPFPAAVLQGVARLPGRDTGEPGPALGEGLPCHVSLFCRGAVPGSKLSFGAIPRPGSRCPRWSHKRSRWSA